MSEFRSQLVEYCLYSVKKNSSRMRIALGLHEVEANGEGDARAPNGDDGETANHWLASAHL